MDALKELKRVLEKEIEDVSKKNDISPSELERVYKAVDVLKDIETICAMRDYGYEEEDMGYSGRYPYYMRDMSRTAPNYDPWAGDASYRRGRDNMTGRYVSRDVGPYSYDGRSYGYDRGYSSRDSKEEMRMELMDKLNTAKTDKERMAIQTVLDLWKE